MILKQRSMQPDNGFTAIETIITLIIGALFVLAGNQIFSNVLTAGARSENRAKASAIAYEYLRSKAPTIGATCSATTPTTQTFNTSNTPSLGTTGLSNVVVTVTASCPYTTSPLNTLTKITSRITYGTGDTAGEVHHATFMRP